MLIYIFVFLFLLLIFNLYKIYSLNSKIIKTNIISINKNRIIFIIPNIYELNNYEANKYKFFINYLIANNYECIVLTSLINNVNDKNIIIKNYNGIIYKTLKYPILTKKQITNEILNGDEIFIVNKELIWIYGSLINIKKKYSNIKIYISCEDDNYNFPELKSMNIKYLRLLLKNNIFNGVFINQLFSERVDNAISVSYKNYTNNIYDTYFVNLELFKKYKINKYDNKEYNVFFTGNVNDIIYVFSLFYSTDNLLEYNYNFHILTNLKKSEVLSIKIKSLYPNLYDKIKMYDLDSEIFDLFIKLNNRIYILINEYDFIFMKAGMTGIPIFIKENKFSNIADLGIIFSDKKTFINEFNNFNKLFATDKLDLILDQINKIKKYDKNLIFNNWLSFIKNNQPNIIIPSSLLNKHKFLLYIFIIKYFCSLLIKVYQF
jgi:hypothetical protein